MEIAMKSWDEDYKAEEIRRLLGDLPWGRELDVVEELPSTNEELLVRAAESAPEGTVLLADRQSAGRGRERRQWYNPAGSNIAMSWLLRPDFAMPQVPSVVMPISLGVCRALEEASGLKLEIKWPNDILYQGAKLCGILCESRLLGSRVDALVVGVGINVNTEHFPRELNAVASSLRLISGRSYRRDEVAAGVLRHCWQCYQDYFYGGKQEEIGKAYCAASATLGRRVALREGEKTTMGFVEAIDEEAVLYLCGDDGVLRSYRAGEISLRPKDNGF